MKKHTTLATVTIAILTLMVTPVQLAAQQEAEHTLKHHRYKLIDLGTFGGPNSYLQVASGMLNNNGVLVGWADTSAGGYPEFCFNPHPGDGFASHAFRWRHGKLTDLGAVPGGNTSQAVWIAPNGLIAGYSSNGQLDPLVFGFPQARAALWRGGNAIDLGTFGGNESTAYAVNSRGQVVGAALNATTDPYSFVDFLFCGSSNGTQTRAFLWDKDNGMQDLGTLGTGNDALAAFVNEAGQVAGFAYTNSIANPTTGLPTFHPFLWEKGKGMQDLGTIGGTIVFNISGLNRRGQVVGTQTLPGDATWHPFLWDGKKLVDLGTLGGDQDYGNWINDAGEVVGQGALPGAQEFHAFIWKKGKKIDLGLLPGDFWSDPAVINSRSQIVGASGNSTSSSAVLWENGQIVDLNTLVSPGSGLTLYAALYINDPGEIAAFAVDSSGNNHDALLIPCDGNHAGSEGCDCSSMDASASAFVRPALSETLGRPPHPALWLRNTRFHLPAVGPRD